MESSHDYASIPGSPMDTPVRRVSFEELPQIGQLPQIVNTLKKRLIDQMKKSYSQDIVSDYMPVSLVAAATMLACTRIGAVHR